MRFQRREREGLMEMEMEMDGAGADFVDLFASLLFAPTPLLPFIVNIIIVYINWCNS